jgi:hypothetical protein
MRIAALALIALTAVNAISVDQQAAVETGYKVVNNKIFVDGCPLPLALTQEQLDIELDFFSRKFDIQNYDNAIAIYNALKKEGKDPKVSVHTWELYDHAFPFEKVRRYDLVQQHMDAIQHFEDNLNENFTNQQNVRQFIIVGKAAQTALNTKYHNGEFADPANFDPTADHPATWSNVKF